MICKKCHREVLSSFNCLCSDKAEMHINIPVSGEWYIHRNGNIYEVILLANEQSKNDLYPITVVYKGKNDLIWAKELSNFNLKMRKIKFASTE